MDKKDRARRRLGELTDTSDKVELMIVAELGEELIEMLPILIEQDACEFRAYNEPCNSFSVNDICPDHGNLYVWLWIKLGLKQWSINFAGLMRQFGSSEKAAVIVQLIMSRKEFGGRDFYQVDEVNEADVYAVRTHHPTSTFRQHVELSLFYHALKEPVAVGHLLNMLPERATTHRVPAEQHLTPLVEHLRSIGVSDIIIDEMVEMLFKAEEDGDGTLELTSLDKVVALAGMHQGQATKPIRAILRPLLKTILEMHFSGNPLFAPSTNMKWLANHLLPLSDAERMVMGEVLTEELSKGKLTAVHHFLTTIVMSNEHGHGRVNTRAAKASRDCIMLLLPAAFRMAKDRKDYGFAAAIAHICDNIPDDEREDMTDAALTFNQRICVMWDYLLH